MPPVTGSAGILDTPKPAMEHMTQAVACEQLRVPLLPTRGKQTMTNEKLRRKCLHHEKIYTSQDISIIRVKCRKFLCHICNIEVPEFILIA